MYFMKRQKNNPLTKLTRDMMILRNQMSMIIDNFWSYFHLDVLKTQWDKLKSNMKSVKDFEDLRNLILTYLNSISSLVFLNIPAIVNAFFELIDFC
jgi:hypothetical protein